VSDPVLIVRRDDRDGEGNLLPGHLAEIRRVLEDRGFVLLPSDTAYSIAAWLRSEDMRRQLNAMLGREDDEPISVAFSSVQDVQGWTAENDFADELLASFTPGPITVVRSAARRVPVEFTKEILRSANHTLGVRIPNSAIERLVASVGSSPVTTVPVRRLSEERPPPVTSFDEAVSIITERTEEVGAELWCAVEGEEIRYGRTSTVVEVLGEGRSYIIRRPGAIPEDEIQACAERR
jgi:tRNA A37 threonylcarbamoyladenosine synthetase subunit TsaC/SUA5/YrdC